MEGCYGSAPFYNCRIYTTLSYRVEKTPTTKEEYILSTWSDYIECCCITNLMLLNTCMYALIPDNQWMLYNMNLRRFFQFATKLTTPVVGVDVYLATGSQTTWPTVKMARTNPVLQVCQHYHGYLGNLCTEMDLLFMLILQRHAVLAGRQITPIKICFNLFIIFDIF